MSTCIFCDIVEGKIPSFKLYENEFVYAFLDAFPNSEGHSLVIPKKHFDDFQSCDEKSIVEVAKARKIVADMLKESLIPVGFNYISNQSEEAFQKVFHYHEHIIPKYIKEEGYRPTVNLDREKMAKNEEIHEKIMKKLPN